MSWSPSAVQQERLAYRRGRATRSALVGLGSTVSVVLVIGLTIPLTRLTDRVARRQGWQGTVGAP